MFSHSIRKHPGWAPIVPRLSGLKIKETRLEGHDFAVPLNPEDAYRLLFLSSSDLKAPDVLRPKLERLSMLNGGQDVGIAFLLGNDGDTTRLVELQNLLRTLHLTIQIIPILSPTTFIPTLNDFIAGLNEARRWKDTQKQDHPLDSLIPYCTPNEKLARHTANVVSDVCDGFKDLAAKAGSQDGQEYLMERLGGGNDWRDVIEFWGREC